MDASVVIAGGGPTGVWLACELRLAGVSTVVLDELPEVDPHSRALSVHPRTLETLALRDAHRPLLAEGSRLPSWHFAVLGGRLDFGSLDTDFPFTLAIPQQRTTTLFEQRARALGARILRAHRLTEFVDHGEGVVVSVEGPTGEYSITAEYLVGCDGTRGAVRRGAGIEFDGSRFSALGWLGEVTLDRPPPEGMDSVWTPDGTAMCVALPNGEYRLAGNAPEDVRTDWPGNLTFDEFRELVTRVMGTDYGMHSPTWLSRFRNSSRLATSYRQGRVLLAGDAAHQHMPAGGVGLNVGVQDAMNLGWKLAATINGWASDNLLDSYHSERHPVGAETIEHTQAQTAIMTNFSQQGAALRSLLGRFIVDQPQLREALTGLLSGLSVRYPDTRSSHPLVGERAPNLQLSTDDMLFPLFSSGHYVLVEFGLGELDVHDSPRVVRYHHAEQQSRPHWSGIGAVLIRPDGYVAWAGDVGDTSRLAAEANHAVRDIDAALQGI